MRDRKDNGFNGPDSDEESWSGHGWALMKPVVESDSLSGYGWGLLSPVGAATLNPAVPGVEANRGQPGALDTPLAGDGAETTQDDDDAGFLNGEAPGGLFAEEDDGPDSQPDQGYLAQDDTVDDAFGLETGSFDTAALQSYTPLQAARDSDDGVTARGTDPATSPGTGTADSDDAITESNQAVEDGFYGPPPPHEFEQVGCACACCSDIQPGEVQDDSDSASVGAPDPATSIQDLARYLSEYNSTITGSNGRDDFWDEFWGPSNPDGYTPNFHWNLTSSGTDAKNGTLTYNISGSWYDSDGITDDGADSQTKIDAIRHALNVYEDILGINFVETTLTAEGDVDIAFGNEDPSGGAFANFNADGQFSDGNASGIMSNAWINIDKGWPGNGTIGDQYFSTVLHEVGHALGLGHAGNYNADPDNPPTYNDAYWANDTMQYSMMSYWAQDNYTAPGENTPSGDFRGDVNYIGPQSVDWFALNRMYDDMGYGIDDGATTSDTTWGFNSTWYDWTPSSSGPGFGYANTAFASLYTLLSGNTMTIVDGGGNDTLDLSGFNNNTKIDISIVSASDTTPSFSDVAGLTGNLMIGVDTVIEKVIGGAGSEEIIGNTAANVLEGGGGDDNIRGSTGNDSLFGGADDDKLYGDNGHDELQGGSGADKLYGGNHRDLLRGGADNDALYGGADDDKLYGDNGHDVLRGDDGNDRLYGGNHRDRLHGGTGNDALYGGAHEDTLYGDNGHDVLRGDDGNDRLYGGNHRDRLIGGVGNDIMTGGEHEDTFVFADGFGTDRITDFDSFDAGEKIDLTAVSSIASFADLTANHMSQIGSDVVINDGAGNTITLSSVILGNLDSTDFIF